MRIRYSCFLLIVIVEALFMAGCSRGYTEYVEGSTSDLSAYDAEEITSEVSVYVTEDFNVNEWLSVDENLFELVTKEYTDEELEDIVTIRGTVEELNALYPVESVKPLTVYPIECVRPEDNVNLYRVAYVGDTSYAVVGFNKTGIITGAEICNKSINSEEFMPLNKSNYLDDVMELDPQGDYDWFTAGTSIYKTSYHYTSDGYYITINYDDEYKIKDIHKELI